MKKSVMEKWVKTLRSGRYKQGQDALKNIHREYCCLGVLCNISKTGKWSKKPEYYGLGLDYLNTNGTGTLPEKVKKWAGMNSRTGLFSGNSLIDLNDTGKSFKEIADVIEKNWRKL
jgi:hypothetical protein